MENAGITEVVCDLAGVEESEAYHLHSLDDNSKNSTEMQKTNNLSSDKDKVMRSYTCTECGAIFSSRNDFDDHLNLHPEHKPYICEFCEACFNRRSTLWNHKRIHSDHKPFTCPLCQMQFKWKNSLKCHREMHMRKHEKFGESGTFDVQAFNKASGYTTSAVKSRPKSKKSKRPADNSANPNMVDGETNLNIVGKNLSPINSCPNPNVVSETIFGANPNISFESDPAAEKSSFFVEDQRCQQNRFESVNCVPLPTVCLPQQQDVYNNDFQNRSILFDNSVFSGSVEPSFSESEYGFNFNYCSTPTVTPDCFNAHDLLNNSSASGSANSYVKVLPFDQW